MAINSAPSRVNAIRNIKNDGTEATTGMVPTIQSDGKVDFATPGGGGAWVFLGREVINFTAAAIQSTGLLTDTYRVYRLVIEFIDSNFSHFYRLRFTNSGVQLTSSDYDYHLANRSGSSESYQNGSNQPTIEIVSHNSADGQSSGVFTIFRPLDADTDKFPQLVGELISSLSLGMNRSNVAAHFDTAGQNIDGVRLYSSDSNVIEGAISIYGLKNS